MNIHKLTILNNENGHAYLVAETIDEAGKVSTALNKILNFEEIEEHWNALRNLAETHITRE